MDNRMDHRTSCPDNHAASANLIFPHLIFASCSRFSFRKCGLFGVQGWPAAVLHLDDANWFDDAIRFDDANWLNDAIGSDVQWLLASCSRRYEQYYGIELWDKLDVINGYCELKPNRTCDWRG